METNITVSGSIVKELSEKIPNNIIALNELIKNAYDAGSKQVDICISTSNNKMIIKDYGVGMDESDIKKLFHISSSSKKYGKITNVNNFERITQGSKGLGFLSVFKFGNIVSWKTKKDKVLSFTADYSEISKLEYINQYTIPISEIEEEDFIGTEIEIELIPYNLKTLSEYFQEEKNRKKVLNSFICSEEENKKIQHDPDFIINLNIDGKQYETDLELKLENELMEQQLVRIKYNSENNKIFYYSDLYGGNLVYSEDFDFNNTDFTVNIDLQTYVLKSNGKKKISQLFYHPVSEKLTPLIYVNNNLFNNYELFDTNVMSTIKYEKILSQIIGYISIVSSDESIDFNSDRTKFVQNDLTDRISEFLKAVNIKIQTTGSEIKNELNGKIKFLKKTSIEKELITENFDYSSLIKEDFKLKSNVTYEKNGDSIDYELFGMKKSIKIITKEKEVVEEAEVEYYPELTSEKEILKEVSGYDTITLNGQQVEKFDHDVEGEWTFSKETDNEILQKKFIKQNSQQPKVSQKIKVVNLDQPYSYDDLFTFINSFYEEDKKLEVLISTDDPTIHNDSKRGLLTFGKEGESSVVVNIKDKITEKTYELTAIFRVVFVSNEIKKINNEVSFVRMPISRGENLPENILGFISELNKLSIDANYSYSFVSSFRTLVELCVIDILRINKEAKETNLASNYKKVLELYPSYVESIEDEGDKQTINNLLNSINTTEERKAYISFLNLCTHGSNTMISKKEVEYKTKELTLLLEYLNHLNS
ncbi:ATP-binding protein [Aerococcus viridans]|uniref:ATP-binding protein n=1 Tax=Aerococcus viridans TaxID=1377 RepID=UPI0039AFF8EA